MLRFQWHLFSELQASYYFHAKTDAVLGDDGLKIGNFDAVKYTL